MLTIIKVGGQLIEEPKQLAQLLDRFSAISGSKILVHGGGRKASQVAKKMNVPTQMHEGRRITDQANLDIATMVYAGLVNKTIVAELQARNCNAIGLCGADGNMILSKKRPVNNRFGVDFGFVGDVEKVNAKAILALLSAGFIPVFNAITHDKNGQLLNTNADTIATEIAKAMKPYEETKLIYCFEKSGVLLNVEDEKSIVLEMDALKYKELKQEKVIYEGMIPKLDNAFDAKQHGVQTVIVGGITAIQNDAIGTQIL